MAISNKGSVSPADPSSETTVVSSGAKIEGKFYFTSMLHVDGKLNGIIHSESIVVIGKNGNLKGELKSDKIVVNGVLEGELEADSLEILAGGFVSGNIVIKEIPIESGGRLSGSSKTKEDEPVRMVENTID